MVHAWCAEICACAKLLQCVNTKILQIKNGHIFWDGVERKGDKIGMGHIVPMCIIMRWSKISS